MFILDADVLIRAKKTYYQFERVPEFWDWLAHQAEIGEVKMAAETWDKIGNKPRGRRDDLAEWAIVNKDNLVVADRSYDARFGEVLEQYERTNGSPLTEADIVRIGDDYQLIACALQNGAAVVSGEVASNAIGPSRKVPNVCDDLGVECIDLDGLKGVPGLVDRLDFRTNWRS